VVANFLDMPEETQARYISMGIVPMHVKIAYAAAHGLLTSKHMLPSALQPCAAAAPTSPPTTPALSTSDSASSLAALSDV
jgi:hypothetical protein